MKAYIRVTDEQGNEYEEELGEFAIFTSYEEIDELIEFLKYVKKIIWSSICRMVLR